MNKLFQLRTIGIALLLMSVTACSVVDSYRSPQPYSQPQAQPSSLPKIPEIKHQTVTKPRYTQPKKVLSVKKAPVKRVLKPTVIRSKQQTIIQDQLKKQAKGNAKEKATVDIDPYANVPETRTVKAETTQPAIETNKTLTSSSPAVRSLMVGARADIALGKHSSAVSKLERGLRIEPQNPELWHLLSKANYSDSNFQQSINMAKKSNRFSNDDNLIAQNWVLIKKAAEKSGNATALKEVLDYVKLNP